MEKENNNEIAEAVTDLAQSKWNTDDSRYSC